ncbi:MAG: hypothetical protein IPK97_04620 [Ahniella sp.]|nr:hypothetical protein [Ahniella sp.]
MRPIPLLALSAVLLCAPVANAEKQQSSTHLKRMSIELPAKGWEVTANGLDSEEDPEFVANWHQQVEVSLGEVTSIPLIQGESVVMLDAYEDALKPVFEKMERQKALPKGLRPPAGFDCRAYRSVMFAGDEADSTDLTCYAPYRGGARFMQVEIKDTAKGVDKAALQSALNAIRLID